MADEPKATDAYQAKYMGGDTLFHDKMTAPLAYHLIFLLPLLIIFATSLSAKVPIAVPLVTAVVVASIWALFSSLRISVSRQQVYVQYGLFGPKIPVEAIESCEACDYDWTQYGGFGIRLGRDGSWAYNMLGDGGRAVKIRYRKGKNTRTVILASRDPERLALAIHQARAGAMFSMGEMGERVEALKAAAAAATEADIQATMTRAGAEMEASLEEAAAEEAARRESEKR